MSDRTNDIRMYVERLFQGRTLDAETIELKEEIYGNLIARYEDYLLEGMDADEAYRRTCEAVTSVEDVISARGEKDAAAAEATQVVPRPADAGGSDDGRVPPPDVPVPPGGATAASARRRWSGGKIAAVVVAAVVGVAILGSAAFGIAAELAEPDRAARQDSAVTTPVDDTTGGSDASAMGGDATSPVTDDQATTPQGDAQGQAPSGGQSGAQSQTSTGATGDATLTTDGLDQAINAYDPAPLSAYADAAWPVSSETLAQIAGGLPLSEHLMSAGTDVSDRSGNVITLEYAWVEDDRVARTDDDAVERAVTYDATTLLAAIGSADSVRVTIRETDAEDGELNVDALMFRRADVEAVLGTELTSGRLTDGTWGDLRSQLSLKRTYDRIWDRAEID
ncbi:hypothetical protein [Olsenella profusa]|uniref:DUF1707 domain-containing protein n=1 Tax=Olsenella profusa TaxID=138595 RepID=A0ABS2F2I9_9ACTN|nr:hypothetical protein [Olsenella profusa]MBM6775095.1 hypothetical protein [Olsenella profusa]